MSKKYKAILFDLDGTLLPMDMEEFTTGYFKFLCKKLKKYGFDDAKLVKTIWTGTKAMAMNDGSVKNRDRFWNTFAEILDGPVEEIDADCLDFYGNEFDQAVCFTQANPMAKDAVALAHEKAEKVVLATNPLFPMVGHDTRMSWVGLKREDFDLVTSYESDSFCKPNPCYFKSVCERIGVEPSECLMIGNDEKEDMFCATAAGIDAYLVTDTMIASEEYPWNGPRGTFSEMMEMLKKL